MKFEAIVLCAVVVETLLFTNIKWIFFKKLALPLPYSHGKFCDLVGVEAFGLYSTVFYDIMTQKDECW